MNFNRFRRRIFRHRARTDWTRKVRVSFTVVVRLTSIQTSQQRLTLNQIRSYVEATKCPLVALSADGLSLLMSGNFSFIRGESLTGPFSITRYAKICYRLLHGSGLAFRLLPKHAYDLLPDDTGYGHSAEDQQLRDAYMADSEIWHDDDARARVQPIFDRENAHDLAYWHQLDNEIFWQYEAWFADESAKTKLPYYKPR